MANDTAIQLKNISKIYKLYNTHNDRLKEALHPFKKKYHEKFYALNGVNLEIKKGEVLGIVGINGAGKSTLLKIISGVLTPTTGRVNVSGRINAILELGAGFKPEMTGKENIKLNLRINGIEKGKERITQEIIEFADIGKHIDQPVKTYSSGMKARLGFGLATATDPDVLIVDEVLAVGDILFKRKCYACIEKLFKDGKTVIFVSHSVHSVVEFCSRAVLLYDKKIIMDGSPKEVTDYYQKLVFSKNQNDVIKELDVQKVKTQAGTFDRGGLNNTKKLAKGCFIEGLNSNPVEYREHEVDIYDAVILDAYGKKVNVLVTGEHYNFQYKVRFDKKYSNVSFGSQFKTIKGQNLSALALYFNKNSLIPEVARGQVSIVTINFKCQLLQGDYFLNAGVSVHDLGKEYYYLNRIVDIMLFRVENDSSSVVKGVLDQNYRLNVARENA